MTRPEQVVWSARCKQIQHKQIACLKHTISWPLMILLSSTHWLANTKVAGGRGFGNPSGHQYRVIEGCSETVLEINNVNRSPKNTRASTLDHLAPPSRSLFLLNAYGYLFCKVSCNQLFFVPGISQPSRGYCYHQDASIVWA